MLDPTILWGEKWRGGAFVSERGKSENNWILKTSEPLQN